MKIAAARPLLRRLSVAHLVALGAVLAGLGACSSGSPAGAEMGPSDDDLGAGQTGSCERPNEGCPCDEVGATTDCGRVASRIGDYVRCSMGTRTCLPSGEWGACEGEIATRTRSMPLAGSSSGGVWPANLATSTSYCASNMCDPYCLAWEDTPSGIDAGPGLEVVPEGLTLTPTGSFGLDTCSSLQITPSSSSLTITSLSPVSPSTIEYSAELLPPGCYPGVATPIWTINDERADSVTITSSGSNATLRVVTPIAGPVTVNAYLGPFVATATAQINVNVVDSTALPAYKNSFDLPSASPDSLSILYPYANTVLPLGLPPPIPQWKGASAAAAVKVTLRYVDGPTSFQWAAITGENAPLTIVAPSVSIPAAPRYPSIPPSVWSLFERSARGRDAQIVVQRIVGASLKAEVPTTIRFAQGQLKGSVYYQSYGTQLARNFNGGAIDSTSGSKVFPGGAFGAATLAIRPGATQPTVVAGGTNGNPPDGAGTYCRVCHTAAADGSLLVTQKYGSGNGTSQRYTNLAGTPVAADMSPGDGRFAWPAIFPNGSFLFSNAGVMASFNSGPAPGGLDGSNSTLTSALYSLATPNLGVKVDATYRTSGTSPITISIPSSAWGLQAGVPAFSSTGTKVAMQFHAGKVCATGSSSQCSAVERQTGDKRSLAIMDFDDAAKRFSNFRMLVTEPDAPCDTRFHPSQPCFAVWPSFMPSDRGVVYEREIFHNGNVGGSSSVSDFGGTRSGCDSSATCNNDGTKAELWWVNVTGSPNPRRLDAANGYTPSGESYLPVGPDAPAYCRVGGFYCTAGSQCCSGTCSNNRCTSLKRTAGTGCSSASECESNKCISGSCGCARDADCASSSCNVSTGVCSSGGYKAAPTMSYVPGHNATVEPVLNYEPTVNPKPTYDANGEPEYYWVVFTSRRMFGNIATIDPWWSDPRRQDISQRVTPKKLWVAAVRANPTAGTDPSYPAFYLPGQEWIAGNSKAYWVENACKPGSVVKSAANECESSLDCCGGSVCKLSVPLTNPAKSYCMPATACVDQGGSCSQSSDCCSGRLCSAGKCQDPPTIDLYGASATFVRDFTSDCSPGHKVEWGFVDYQATLHHGTRVEFRARTADSIDGLASATPLVTVGSADPPSTTGWTTLPSKIDDLFATATPKTASKKTMRLEIELFPTADATAAPILANWRVSYSCVPAE